MKFINTAMALTAGAPIIAAGSPAPAAAGPLVLELSKAFMDKIDIYPPRPRDACGGFRVIKAGLLRPRNPAILGSRTPAVRLPTSVPESAFISGPVLGQGRGQGHDGHRRLRRGANRDTEGAP
jgi:hypothetical protein